MNSRTLLFYSLPAVLALAGCVAHGERRTAHFDRQWPAAPVTRIEVREVDGTIEVVAAPSGVITLGADVRSRGVQPKPNEENQGYFRSHMEGSTLVIGRDRTHRHVVIIPFFRSNDIRVDYTLHVPPSVAMDLHTVNGRIVSHGVEARSEMTAVNGSIEIASPGTSEVEAKTVNGRIEARFEKDFRGAALKTVNGGVVATLPAAASFTGDFSQVNGDFEAGFPLTIHSHPGSRRVSGDVNGGRYGLRITTVNGDIKIDNLAPPVPAVPVVPAAPVTPPTPST
jgi:hypothetical protein